MDLIEIDVALYRGSHRLTQAELFELKKSSPSKEELDKLLNKTKMHRPTNKPAE
ncbi:hypothetical protein LHV02_08420 [Limosilactobacillus fermentum]|uniref:hypothetical protein n=1 Tax=Limosilactobacillus fermentum TaxID=1613 RepID=UPI000AA8F168|nr:hypothetical protein [Limosilactobacillus fermentum]MBC9022816.1 hypothetical protein [Limosilactobacillus fermentum CECT 5716]MCH5387847.1 hypothetical protein [Limosilactobacillus fermentum]MCH5398135.1 hypothetical protein [Limosilactobacillus fermentum]QSE66430.1 hypothetical protein JWS00_04175 [Limosilactobacillus fermentum]QSH34562.1 hypothetical protein JYQ66_04125 [Limosilactobacillus fermentum]